MRIFHSPKHALHHSNSEIHAGKLVESFEKPARMAYILTELQARGFDAIIEPEDQGMAAVQKLHRADYLDFLAGAYDQWLALGNSGDAMTYIWPASTMRGDKIPNNLEGRMGFYSLSTDTTITAGTWEAVLAAKDCAISAAQDVTQGKQAAFSLARPPGHHAASYQYGGYCFLNNAAIAAQTLLDKGAARVSILDVDFHHGNGTQEIFYHRDDVQFVSLHGDPRDCFPYFLGYADERGQGDGEGFNHNYPLPVGTTYPKWREALVAAMRQINAYQPDALVVSLGVDTFEHDPISAFKLTSPDFLAYGRELSKLKLPTVFVMEGGYAVQEIGVNTVNVLDGFLGR